MADLAEEIKSAFARFPSVEKVVLFGSRARGDNTERSDYDFAVYGEIDYREKNRLRAVMNDEMPTLHKIDLVFMNEKLCPNLVGNIESEGIVFYEQA